VDGGGDVEDFFTARARKEVALANLREMDAAKRRGETLNATEVEAEWSNIVSTVRNRILLLPDKLAPRVAALADVLECRAVIERAVREALTALSETEPGTKA